MKDHFKRKYRIKRILWQMLNLWNLLPEDAVEEENTSRLKQRFNKFMNASP